jgi:hypothetical protein
VIRKKVIDDWGKENGKLSNWEIGNYQLRDDPLPIINQQPITTNQSLLKKKKSIIADELFFNKGNG